MSRFVFALKQPLTLLSLTAAACARAQRRHATDRQVGQEGCALQQSALALADQLRSDLGLVYSVAGESG